MLLAHAWDEISGDWGRHALDLPPDTADPYVINDAIGQLVGEETDTWLVKSHARTGPLLTIEIRDNRDHLGIILVNYEAHL